MAARIPVNCIKCHKSIKRRQNALHALQQIWHTDCFRCSICRARLHEEFFSRKNALFCRQHYLENFAHSCHKCFKKVTGLIMISGDVSFHPECFRCMRCRCVIGHGDNYVFEERSQLYCEGCYEVDIGKYMKYKEFKTFYKGAIHQVHITPSMIKQRQLSFKYKEQQKENLLTGLQKKLVNKPRSNRVSIVSDNDQALKTGDMVLEINGIPITSNNIKHFSELLETSDSSKRISVTIERIPHSNDCQQQPCDNKQQHEKSHHHHHQQQQQQQQEQEQKKQPKPSHNTTPEPNLEVYKRNISYFNYDVVKRRTGSDPSTVKRRMALNRLKVVQENSEDGLTESDRQKLKRVQENGQPKNSESAAANRVRSRSLGDIQKSLVEDADAFLIKKDLMKVESPLHRAQSFKVEQQSNAQSQIFRPTDIEFGETVGQGFFGEVIKVVHKISGKEMVLKKLYNFDDGAFETFLKEVHVLKSLKHPNVLQFIGVMYRNTVLNLILEYIPGGTLRHLLKHKYVELSWPKKVRIAKDIAAGMAYLHSQHVMHRDLKSKNVLIKKQEGDYIPVVADFGLVSIMHEEDSNYAPGSPRTMFRKRNSVVGSAYWMAPEMLKHKPYDETADVFSYGIVMCEIISRLRSDPDEIPRTKDYGLDLVKFKTKIDETCPDIFLQLTKDCCSLCPEQRPPFSCCEKWLDVLLTGLKFDIPIPEVKTFLQDPKPLRLNSLSNPSGKTDSKTTPTTAAVSMQRISSSSK